MYLLRRIPIAVFLAVVGLASAAPNERSEDSQVLDESGRFCSLPRKDSPIDSIAQNNALVTGSRVRRNVGVNTRLWPNGTMYYYVNAKDFNKTGTPEQQLRHRLFYAALDRVLKYTCLTAEESMTAAHTVRVIDNRDKKACGVTGAGLKNSRLYQLLAVSCWDSPHYVLHELFHAYGVEHTHNRPDRDQYVTVQDAHEFQYEIENMTLYVPYDYSSILHYGGGKITTKNPEYQYTIAANFPSFLDILTLNLMYKCEAFCPKETSAKCKNGGYPNPKNCGVCNCPMGYGGPLCDQRPFGCGKILDATKNWQTLQWDVAPNSQREQLYFSEYDEIDISFCTHWIKAPEGSKVEARVVSGSGCIEVRYLENTTHSSPRYCSYQTSKAKAVVTSLNPLPVVSWTYRANETAQFTIEYRIQSDEVVEVAAEIKEQFAFFEKNLNKVLSNEDRDNAARNIFHMYAETNGPLRKVNELLVCQENPAGSSTFGETFEWLFANQQLLWSLSTRLGMTSVENTGNVFDERKEEGKTAVTTKWAFKKKEKKTICDVTLLFGESPQKKYQLEKTTIRCPNCLLQ